MIQGYPKGSGVSMIATLLVAWIVFATSVKVLKTSVNKAFIAAVSVVLLEAAFGISPQDIWQQVIYMPQNLSQTADSSR